MKLTTKINALPLAVIIAYCFLFFFALKYTEKKIYEEKALKTRHLVETAVSAFNKVYQSEVPATKEQAKELIRALRYEDDQYFWINDTNGIMIMHPYSKKLEGKSVLDFKDAKGKTFFQEIVNIAKSEKKGFVNYYWPKPGIEGNFPKISYVKLIPDTDWIIGSGIYVDDVKSEIKKIYFTTYSICCVLSIFILVITILFARSITVPISGISDFLKKKSRIITHSSNHFSDSSSALAASSEEQASSVEEISSSIEEISAMTSNNALNAKEASKKMSEALLLTKNGTQEINKVSEVIKTIKKSSDETVVIIKAINDISFQTNLLALNAAVEAAHAGENGKGFSVIAAQIRELAIKAGEAVEKTNELLKAVQEKAKEGTEQGEKITLTTQKIFQSVQNISTLLEEISHASNEQSLGIQQVNDGISQITSVTQNFTVEIANNAHQSEELAKLAKELLLNVEGLDNIVHGYSNRNEKEMGSKDDKST